MKLAFVTLPGHWVLPAAGSVEIWEAEVAGRLAADHDVTIIASRSARTADQERDGVRYRFVAHTGERALGRLARPAWRLRPADRAYFSSMLYPISYWAGVGRMLRRDQVDVAHVFNYSQALPVLARLAPGTRLVLHMHCEWLMQLDRRMLARRLAHADAVLSCSSALTEGARQRFPELADRFHTVPNGIDAAALDVQRDRARPPRRLLYVGRISPEKGLHVLMDAFASLVAEGRDLELELVGEVAAPPPETLIRLSPDPRVRALESFYAGDYAAGLRARLPEAERRRMRFAGVVPYAEIADHYRAADVFVLPSLMEAFGMPLAEAMAAGLPAVAARTGGIPDVVEDGVTGLLVPAGAADALADALRRVLDDPALRGSLAAAGRDRVRRDFGWDRVAASAAARHAAACRGREPASSGAPAAAALADGDLAT